MDLLAAMRIYARVVERTNMSAAARDLGIRQPSVSERIDRLERHLGVRLLHRSRRAISCTAEGREFYVRCKAALAAAEAACDVAAQGSRPLEGSIRIASPQCFGEVVMPKIIAGIHVEHPGLRIDLVVNDRVVDPVTEGVDLSLRLCAASSEHPIRNHLGYVHRSLVAAPHYVASHGPIDRVESLARHVFIHVNGLFSHSSLSLQDGRGGMLQAPIRPIITTTHWRPMHDLILSGVGIGVVQTPGCAADLAAGRLVRLLPQYEVPRFELVMLMPTQRPVPPKITAAIAAIKRCLPNVPGFSSN